MASRHIIIFTTIVLFASVAFAAVVTELAESNEKDGGEYDYRRDPAFKNHVEDYYKYYLLPDVRKCAYLPAVYKGIENILSMLSVDCRRYIIKECGPAPTCQNNLDVRSFAECQENHIGTAFTLCFPGTEGMR